MGNVFSESLKLKRPSGRPHGKLELKISVKETRYPAPEPYYPPPYTVAPQQYNAPQPYDGNYPYATHIRHHNHITCRNMGNLLMVEYRRMVVLHPYHRMVEHRHMVLHHLDHRMVVLNRHTVVDTRRRRKVSLGWGPDWR
ncbi:hypothetical protein Hdeb2414_s0020g00551961 [Helianthus debilis subsp. tardiflorus]